MFPYARAAFAAALVLLLSAPTVAADKSLCDPRSLYERDARLD